MRNIRTWSEVYYPKADGNKYNYYEYCDLKTYSIDEFKKKIKEAVECKQREIYIYSEVQITENDVIDAIRKAYYKKCGYYNTEHTVYIELEFLKTAERQFLVCNGNLFF